MVVMVVVGAPTESEAKLHHSTVESDDHLSASSCCTAEAVIIGAIHKLSQATFAFSFQFLSAFAFAITRSPRGTTERHFRSRSLSLSPLFIWRLPFFHSLSLFLVSVCSPRCVVETAPAGAIFFFFFFVLAACLHYQLQTPLTILVWHQLAPDSVLEVLLT